MTTMDYAVTLRAMRTLKVQTGSLICLDCPFEDGCSVHGCAILRNAREHMVDLERALRSSEEARSDLARQLAAARKQADELTKAGLIATDKANQSIAELKAYKDTGLEPEEIAEFMKRWERAVEIAELCKKGGIDHLLELKKAENDGRLVVLPCKVGDTVYEVCNNTDACSGCQNYEGIYGSGESWCTKIDDVDLRSYPNIAERPLCKKQFMEVVEHSPNADWIFNHRNDFGKTVFMTREEAEAALAGKG